MAYYNNNNRGAPYGNQNNFYNQPNQNAYPNQNQNNNFRRLSAPGAYQNNNNNYNPGFNYNQNNNNYQQQQNYNNQNQQNQQNNVPFISINMGRILITSETLDTFLKSLKITEWTNNPNYLQANNIPVNMKLNINKRLQCDYSNLPNRFNDYEMRSNFNYNNLINYLTELNNSKNKQEEQKENDRRNFIKNNFPNENPYLSMRDLYVVIGQNRKNVVMKDSDLYRKVERLLPLLKPVEVPKDFKKEEDKKNNDDFSLFTNKKSQDDSKKCFTNGPTPGTPGC